MNRYFKLLKIILGITYSILVFTTYVESIAGGFPAMPHLFTYQVAIVKKDNLSELISLACSGSIIAKNLILSAAECFINKLGNLQQYEFSIITSTINWRLHKGIEILIDLIYLPSEGNYDLNNIAIAKVQKDLRIINNTCLSALGIPYSNEPFYGKVGIVTGYGYSWPVYLYNNEEIQDLLEDIVDSLKYARVLIRRNKDCLPGNKHINTTKQFCGFMRKENSVETWGICEKDAGSPLVFQNKVVGIAGKNHHNCDDTVSGVAYTNVSAYAPFVNSIIDGNPLPGTLIHHNRKQVLARAASAA